MHPHAYVASASYTWCRVINWTSANALHGKGSLRHTNTDRHNLARTQNVTKWKTHENVNWKQYSTTKHYPFYPAACTSLPAIGLPACPTLPCHALPALPTLPALPALPAPVVPAAYLAYPARGTCPALPEPALLATNNRAIFDMNSQLASAAATSNECT